MSVASLSAAGVGAHTPAAGPLPEVEAEVAAVFERYERALREADVAVLTELFWADPRCVRYGVADRQRGAVEIAAWRAANPGVPPGRTLSETVVLATSPTTAVVSTLFGYPGSPHEGRQTQTWVKLPEGWRIVAAHVSQEAREAPEAQPAEPTTGTVPT